MKKYGWAGLVVAVLAAAVLQPVLAQGRPDPDAVIAAQREAQRALAFMDGVWRGSAWMLLPTGERRTVAQTERVGVFLEGALRVIEGRGYGPDDRVVFNALGILSFDPERRVYSMRSYAHGRVGDFAFAPSAEGFVWEVPAGPATIRYTATIRNGSWREVGERVVPGRDPVQFFEMNLTRIGDSDWPAAGAIAPR